jgi:hypothetical protein
LPLSFGNSSVYREMWVIDALKDVWTEVLT